MPTFKPWIFCALLLLLTSALYLPFLHNPIVFDDMHFFVPGGTSMLPQFTEFSPLNSRWLPYATLGWSMNAFGDSMIPLRIEALILHAAVGMALFLFTRNLYLNVLSIQSSTTNGLPLVWAAFFCALLFLLNPVAVYGAAYLVQRTIVMATLFGLLSLMAYMRGLNSDNQNWFLLSVLLYWLAILSKPNAIMLPAIAVALTILLNGFSINQFKRLGLIYGGFLLGAVFVILQSKGILGATYEVNAVDMLERISVEHGALYSALTQSGLFFKYLFLWVFPFSSWMSVDMREPFAQSVFSWYGLAAIGFACYGWLAIKLLLKRGAYGIIGFALLFPWLLFFSEFSVIRIQESFVLYRSYLWVPGLFMVLPLLICKLEGRFVAIMLLCLSLIFASLALGRLVTFKHGFLLWDDAARLVDGKSGVVGADRIYANRGLILKNMLRYPDAIADLKQAIVLRPKFGYYHHNLAVIYLESGEYLYAISEFERSIELAPENNRGYYGIALAYLHLNQLDLAKKNFAISCKMGLPQACEKFAGLDKI